MKRREAVDERRIYTGEEKEYILSKTGGRCAHCGKKLTVKTMQKDHSIPWSKGGISDVENIVPLCAACNKEKADKVLDPGEYFKYLRTKHLKNLQEYFNKYIRDVEYLNLTTLFPLDEYNFKVGIPLKAKSSIKTLYKDVKYKKAVYYELDEIYEFFLRYNSIHNIYPDVDEKNIKNKIKDDITNSFLFGCIMYSRLSSGEIGVVIVVSLMSSGFYTEKTGPVRVRGKLLESLGFYLHLYLNPDIKLDNISLSYDSILRPSSSSDIARFFYYGLSVDYLSSLLISNFKKQKNSLYSISIVMPSSDPRSKAFLINILSKGNPTDIDEDSLLVWDEKAGIMGFTHYAPMKPKLSESMVELKKANHELASFVQALNGEIFIYNKIRDSNLYLRYLKSVVTDSETILMSDAMVELNMSCEEFYKYLMALAES